MKARRVPESWSRLPKSLGVTTFFWMTEKKISIWFSQEAWMGVWIMMAFGQAAARRRMAAWPRWSEPLPAMTNTRGAFVYSGRPRDQAGRAGPGKRRQRFAGSAGPAHLLPGQRGRAGRLAAIRGLPRASRIVKQSLAAVLSAPRAIEVVPVPVGPRPAAGAWLEVEACGVCGSDWSWYAERPISAPFVPGHEIVGRITHTWGYHGNAAFEVGGRVAIEEALPCWSCAVCRSGRHRLCPRSTRYAPGYCARAVGRVLPVHVPGARDIRARRALLARRGPRDAVHPGLQRLVLGAVRGPAQPGGVGGRHRGRAARPGLRGRRAPGRVGDAGGGRPGRRPGWGWGSGAGPGGRPRAGAGRARWWRSAGPGTRRGWTRRSSSAPT